MSKIYTRLTSQRIWIIKNVVCGAVILMSDCIFDKILFYLWEIDVIDTLLFKMTTRAVGIKPCFARVWILRTCFIYLWTQLHFKMDTDEVVGNSQS